MPNIGTLIATQPIQSPALLLDEKILQKSSQTAYHLMELVQSSEHYGYSTRTRGGLRRERRDMVGCRWGANWKQRHCSVRPRTSEGRTRERQIDGATDKRRCSSKLATACGAWTGAVQHTDISKFVFYSDFKTTIYCKAQIYTKHMLSPFQYCNQYETRGRLWTTIVKSIS